MPRYPRPEFRNEQLACRTGQLVGKDGLESPRFVLIVQHDDGDDAQLLLARVTYCHFALQVLHKAVREAVKGALAAGILLVTRAAVGTNEFDLVLLRIAVQSSPAGTAHADSL